MEENFESRTATRGEQHRSNEVCPITPENKLCEGMVCPRCKAARLTYNGLLNLTCPHCDLTETGAFT